MHAHSLPSLKNQLAALIASRSVSSTDSHHDTGNRAAIDLLAGWLADLGCEVRVQEIPGAPGKANVIARFGPAHAGHGLLLAGHMDTVPFDENRWQSDPLTLSERDGVFYGLGVADMKGFFPLVIEALRGIDPRTLKAPVWIAATADEESTMSGIKTLVSEGVPPVKYAVIGEPTGLTPIRAHKGILMEAIRLTGRSGHSSDPRLGVNALDAMHAAMGELMRWREKLKSRFHDDAFAVPHPTLNLGCIHGGDSPNRICAMCELHIDLRLMPGMLPDAMREEMHRLLTPIAEQHRVQLDILPLFSGTPAMGTSANSAIVRAAEEFTGQRAGTVAFGTEGPYLAEAGIETVILGPGDIAVAHQPDECLRVDRIAPTASLLQAMVRRFCAA